MDGPQRKRRPFQFSLRKLLLWSVVWALYLSIVRITGVPLLVSAVLTAYFAIFFLVSQVVDAVDWLDSHADQFSLRRLVLWTGVGAIYLGVLRLTGIEPYTALCLTAFLAVFLAARIQCGFRLGCPSALGITGIPLLSVGAAIAGDVNPGFAILGGIIGVFFGFCLFLVVHAVVTAVNWIDSLMRPKTPPDERPVPPE